MMPAFWSPHWTGAADSSNGAGWPSRLNWYERARVESIFHYLLKSSIVPKRFEAGSYPAGLGVKSESAMGVSILDLYLCAAAINGLYRLIG